MTTSRRDFIKTAGVAAGALSFASLPSWISDVTAAEEAAANGVDKNALADIALSTATQTRRHLRRHSHQSLSQRIDCHARAAGAERFARSELRLRRARALQRNVGICFEPQRHSRTTCDASRSRRSRSRAQTQSTNASASRSFRSRRSSPPGRALSKKIHSTSRSTTRSSFCLSLNAVGDEDPGRQFRQLIDGLGQRAEVLCFN